MSNDYKVYIRTDRKTKEFKGNSEQIIKSMKNDSEVSDKRLIYAGKEFNLDTLNELFSSISEDEDNELHIMVRDKIPNKQSSSKQTSAKKPSAKQSSAKKPRRTRGKKLSDSLNDLNDLGVDDKTLLHICCGLASETYRKEDDSYEDDIYEVFPDVLLPYYNNTEIDNVVIIVVNIDPQGQNEDLKRKIEENAGRVLPEKSIEVSFIYEELKKEPDFIVPLTTLLEKGYYVILSDYMKIHLNYGKDGGFNGNSKLNLYAFEDVQNDFKDKFLLLNGCGSLGWMLNNRGILIKAKPPPLAVVFNMEQIPRNNMGILQDIFLNYVRICQGVKNHIQLFRNVVTPNIKFFTNVTEKLAEEKKAGRKPWNYFDVENTKAALKVHIPQLLIKLKEPEEPEGNTFIPDDKYINLDSLFMNEVGSIKKRKKSKKKTKRKSGKKKKRLNKKKTKKKTKKRRKTKRY